MAQVASFSTIDGRKVRGRLVSNDDETETWKLTIDGSEPRYLQIERPPESLERALAQAPNENTRRVIDQELRTYRERALAMAIIGS